MVDVIWGTVSRVIDGDTFEMKVTRRQGSNAQNYNDRETIRISDKDAPELGGQKGRRAKRDLENALMNERVRCEVEARDTYGRVVAKVKKTGG